MTLAIPTLAPDVPVKLRSGVTDTGHAALAYLMANAGHMQPADLRVGSGGLRRMVEKVFARWWAEAGLPARLTSPLQFHISTDLSRAGIRWTDGSRPQPGEPWLVLSAFTQVRRYYLRRKFESWHARRPLLASHALAVLYKALDRISYSLTPPRYLDFARRYWWQGGEDLAPGQRRTTGFLTRKMFETRFAACSLAPVMQPDWTPGPGLVATYRGRQVMCPTAARFEQALNAHGEAVQLIGSYPKRTRHPWAEVRAVENRLFHPCMLTRNAFELTELPVVDYPVIVRWRWNDDHTRLGDHWFAELEDSPSRAVFTGAWPLRNQQELEFVRTRLPATVRLIDATDRLLDLLADSSTGGFFG
jgi:hypothetical protein